MPGFISHEDLIGKLSLLFPNVGYSALLVLRYFIFNEVKTLNLSGSAKLKSLNS
jgi:hypothetical protein